MKTPEDEAFEDIERRQGGFQAKRQMAADKLQEPAQEPVAWNKPELKTLKHSDNCRYWDEDIYCTCGAIEYAELQFWKNKALAQPPLPVQRPWVELNEEDFAAINQSCLTKLQAATSAESILKERNS